MKKTTDNKSDEQSTDLIELYGACVFLNKIIKEFTTLEQKEKGNAPGVSYLKEKFIKLYSETQAEIFKDFTGTLNKLSEIFKEGNPDD